MNASMHRIAPLVVAASMLALPRLASACGGTFCDGGGPQVMPVDQTGENILFVLDGDTVEAHVQIQYTGDPAQFAWIVPMQAVPEVEVGSDPLFTQVLAATVPTFTLNQRFDGGDCGDGGGLCATKTDALAAGGRGDEGDSGDSGDPGEPGVVAQGSAGAFEYTVLEGGTVEGIVAWLDDNGYARDDDAPPLLAEYLAEDFVFVAFKLRAGAEIDQIHPVVLRCQGDEPCVPIRLTRIAAIEDMAIRVFFLGSHRVVPTNYRHTRINPLRVDWLALGANYAEVVTLAVDDGQARGRSFVTEYAGASSVVARIGIDSQAWDSARFVDLPADRLIDELVAQGLVSCQSGACVPVHPLAEGLVNEYFPPPPGETTASYWQSWPSRFGDDGLDPNDWPSEAFAATFEERIVGPGEHASDLLDANGYLTRMFTTMSPAEMTEDPIFHANGMLPEVSNQLAATLVSGCDGPTHIELEDGRHIQLDDDGLAPQFDEMPSAEANEEVPLVGAPIVLDDHRETIDAELRAWNDAHGGDDGCGCRLGRLRLEGLLLLGLVVLGLRARRR
jgi:uncharacterized protein DUF2330